MSRASMGTSETNSWNVKPLDTLLEAKVPISDGGGTTTRSGYKTNVKRQSQD